LISAGLVAGVTGSPLESLVSMASEMVDWSFAPVRAFLAGGIAGVSVCDRRASVVGCFVCGAISDLFAGFSFRNCGCRTVRMAGCTHDLAVRNSLCQQTACVPSGSVQSCEGCRRVHIQGSRSAREIGIYRRMTIACALEFGWYAHLFRVHGCFVGQRSASAASNCAPSVYTTRRIYSFEIRRSLGS
jgi:hypothetical protein